MRKGHYAFIPHLSHYTEMEAQTEKQGGFPWETWMAQDLAFLEMCDAFFYIGSSRGADIELNKAQELGMPIYCLLNEVPNINVEANSNGG